MSALSNHNERSMSDGNRVKHWFVCLYCNNNGFISEHVIITCVGLPDKVKQIDYFVKTSTQSNANCNQSQSPPAEKHPLENTWSYWLNTNKSKNWMHNLVELTTFDTVEDYWCLYHYMKVPSELTQGQDYMIFKKGIKPTWEDPINNKGGRWIVCESKSKQFLDPLWLDLVLLMIGENFQYSEEICGAVFNVKTKSKIALWTRGEDKQKNMEIGMTLKKMLKIDNNIHFFKHNTTVAKYSV